MNKKMRELLAKIAQKRMNARDCMDGENKDLEKAAALMDEADELQKEYDLEKRLYEKEKEENTPSEEEAKEYYDANEDQFLNGETVHAKHILVDNEDKCQEILEMITTEEKSFEDAAQEFSTCPSGQQGGDLGSFGKGQMVKEFENAVFDGELNKVIGPVKTQFGYHLIWVDDKNEGEVPEYDSIAEQVKGYLVNKKQQETYQSKLKELREKYCK